MELVPWRPFREVGSLRREMEGMWKRLQNDEWIPPVDISETEDHILVTVELPGIEVKDIDVSLAGDLLTLKGEKRKADHLQQFPYYCQEIYSGPFQRSFRLPSEAKGENIAAGFKNGVLTVTIAKAANPTGKRIEISTAQ